MKTSTSGKRLRGGRGWGFKWGGSTKRARSASKPHSTNLARGTTHWCKGDDQLKKKKKRIKKGKKEEAKGLQEGKGAAAVG